MAISERKKQPFKVLHRIALEKAREIHESPIEKLYSIDEYGDCYYAEGDAEKVRPTQAMMEREVISIHNHPHKQKLSSSFSGEDIFSLMDSPHIQEIIVCGYGVYYWMKRGTCVLDAETIYKLVDDMGWRIANTEYNKAPPGISRKAFKRWVNKREPIFLENYHKELLKLTKEIGLSYGRSKL